MARKVRFGCPPAALPLTPGRRANAQQNSLANAKKKHQARLVREAEQTQRQEHKRARREDKVAMLPEVEAEKVSLKRKRKMERRVELARAKLARKGIRFVKLQSNGHDDAEDGEQRPRKTMRLSTERDATQYVRRTPPHARPCLLAQLTDAGP
jgi:hypothetical protein